ncbi:hypothetical protein F4604DRAFT_1879742 [Suillus subluteus]|nr:hypothetical protein F4604DRAFT_1879742 [Suillus subluteus]
MTPPLYTIIGTLLSTFTRSILFTQVRCVSHSDTAYDNHSFGFLPTLIIHEIDGETVDLNLRESVAIARYIDKVAPELNLHISPGHGKVIIEEQMWEFASLAGAHGVVKPRVAATDAVKLTDSAIPEQIKPAVEYLGILLGKMEELMADEGYVFGSKLSWADFFLFLLLADLKAIPEGELLSRRMLNWMEEMNKL